MSTIRTTSLALAAFSTLIAGSALATSSMAAGRYDIGARATGHHEFLTEMSQDRALQTPQYEGVEQHYAAANAREAATVDGVPGSRSVTKSREAATRKAIASNHG